MFRTLRRNARKFLVAGLVMWSGVAMADAQSDLFAAHEKMLNARVVTDTVSTDAKGRQSKTRTEYDTINRIRITSEQGGFIVLPEGTWMRSGDGSWSQPPFDMSKMFKQLLPQTVDEVRAKARNVKDEGTRTVDGKSLRAISYDIEMKIVGINVSSHTTVFIDDAGRIVRSESEGVAMGKKTQTVQDIRYDDNVRVSAPN
jgi:hypothetical protein